MSHQTLIIILQLGLPTGFIIIFKDRNKKGKNLEEKKKEKKDRKAIKKGKMPEEDI